MALPPKSDDTSSADGETKKRRTTTRTPRAAAKPKAEKAEKAEKTERAEKAEKTEKPRRGGKRDRAAGQVEMPLGEMPREAAPEAREAREERAPREERAEAREARAESVREDRGSREERGPREDAPAPREERPVERTPEVREDRGGEERREERPIFRASFDPSESGGGGGGFEDRGARDDHSENRGGEQGGRDDRGGDDRGESDVGGGGSRGGAQAAETREGGESGAREGGEASTPAHAGDSDQGGGDRGDRGGPGGQGGGQGGQQQHGGGRQQHHQQHGGGRPDWQQRGGGGGDHQQGGHWKQHGKRKRGRHGERGGGGGGGWQPGGGGGGGGGREQHPAQLPPPNVPTNFGDLPNPARFADQAALDALAVELSSSSAEPIWLNDVYAKSLAELTAFARELGVKFEGTLNKRQLLTEIFKLIAAEKRTLRDRGYIDQNDRGSFIVHTHVNYRLYPEDAYLPDSLVKRYGLKRGHAVEVTLQAPQDGDRCPSVVRIDKVMGIAPDDISKVTPFEELVPYYPLQRILLENTDIHPKDVSMRAIDILTPIGFGQRGLIVAPPRTGKTVLLQNIANSISANSPEVKLILLLIDERPEEVTDFKRHTKGEVVSSTFDETPESHVHCAEMVIEICRRRVEQGEHVVVLLDSITRLARAYNALTGSGGKTMSGGLESNALQRPKRFFGSARNIEGGGSLTIIASALIDTGSRMDEIIFEEFKGTGNSELHLDRGLVERRIFPAINIDRSGTRKEELIYHPEELQRIYGLRRAMQGLGPIESMEMLITRLKKTKSNAEFLLALAPK